MKNKGFLFSKGIKETSSTGFFKRFRQNFCRLIQNPQKCQKYIPVKFLPILWGESWSKPDVNYNDKTEANKGFVTKGF